MEINGDEAFCKSKASSGINRKWTARKNVLWYKFEYEKITEPRLINNNQKINGAWNEKNCRIQLAWF